MKNYFDLSGKTALVTGASSGLGVQFARALANQGARVAASARRVSRLNRVREEIEEIGGECGVFPCDVRNSAEVAEMVRAVCGTFGRIDILVNNAGVASDVAATEMTDEEWMRALDPNLNGVFYVGRETARVMKKQKYGKIINIGSIHGNVTLTMAAGALAPYCASKGAVRMLTKAWAAEWAKYNITVNTLAPGYFKSEMTES